MSNSTKIPRPEDVSPKGWDIFVTHTVEYRIFLATPLSRSAAIESTTDVFKLMNNAGLKFADSTNEHVEAVACTPEEAEQYDEEARIRREEDAAWTEYEQENRSPRPRLTGLERIARERRALGMDDPGSE
jgi:hypothetical protein